ncbi:MAG: response regulator [Alphaproteobacteria bacterium]|nr:response regulator [Alphaproteobacteria bacterium]
MARTIAEISVMVIDDNRQAIRLISMMLDDMGVGKVSTANDAKTGWEAITTARPPFDVVVCDWNMPEMTGIELLKKLRSAGNNIPFIMITGRDTIESTITAANAGVSFYMPKPFGPDKLEQKILQATGAVPVVDKA